MDPTLHLDGIREDPGDSFMESGRMIAASGLGSQLKPEITAGMF
jgi:hypothetical protein